MNIWRENNVPIVFFFLEEIAFIASKSIYILLKTHDNWVIPNLNSLKNSMFNLTNLPFLGFCFAK